MKFDRREETIHTIVAAMRFPGPAYHTVLRWLHEELKPERYIEIGVQFGDSLKLAMPPTRALGIDPFPRADDRWNTQTQILPLTSTEFFARHRISEFLGADRFSLAFVDGLHRFGQTLDDILNLERYAGPESVIAVHDTIPLDEETAAPDRRAYFYTGDVWKINPFLKHHRPDLDIVTVRTGPSGMTLIRRLDPCWARTSATLEAIREFEALPWQYYAQHRDDFLKMIPNERGAVAAWLHDRS